MSETALTSPDGLLKLAINRCGPDLSIGFEGYGWHTHGDILAAEYGKPEEEAVERFVHELISDVLLIAVLTRNGVIVDIWFTADPEHDRTYLDAGESVEIRNWSQRPSRPTTC